MEFKKGDKVKLPFGETGKITKIKNIPWGFKYVVKIKTAVFNQVGDLGEFKAEQMELL